MTAQGKFLLDLVAKVYVALALAYCVYIWTVVLPLGTASLRTAIAVIAFSLCVWLPERFTENRFAMPMLKVFGVVGMTVMLVVIHKQSSQ
jgi:hypothetical protein